jgi:hypothetical protein
MSAFYMNEAMFDLPDAEFADRTVTYLVGKSPSGTTVELLVERRALPAGKSLRQLVDEHGMDALKRLRGYGVLVEREVEVASLPAIDVGARWRTEEGESVYTRRTHLILGSAWLIVTGEVPWSERELCNAYVEHVLASLQLRE